MRLGPKSWRDGAGVKWANDDDRVARNEADRVESSRVEFIDSSAADLEWSR